MANKLYTSDFLVIGSGLAGQLFSLKVAGKASVHLVTKSTLTESATYRAQGGIAAVVAEPDSYDQHIKDTIRVGAGLCHPDVVEKFVRAGAEVIKDLEEYGVTFCKDDTCGEYELGLEGGHSERRVLHVKDHTGKDIELALADQVRKNKGITIFENHMGVNLFVKNNRVAGAYVLDINTGEVERFSAKTIILASGGAGRVFLYTSNPDVATGDGIAMAYRVGATLMNMEMMQFHPTLLFHPKIRSSLISEALRGEGAILVGSNGERFMKNYHPDAELAPRDIVARAIDNEMKKTGADHVWLDISFKDSEFVKDRFPAIYETCLKAGVDITSEPIPVVPAAHYMMGGIKTDMHGRTDVEGLYAIGESACSGFHGANRLASNSLLEAAAMAKFAADSALEEIEQEPEVDEIPPWDPGEATDADELVVITHLWDEIRRLMANYVGIVRSQKRLIRARNRIGFIVREINQFYWDYKVTKDLIELRNISLVAEVIIKMARMRKECRGAHYNKDFPDKWESPLDTILKKGFSPIKP
ncbi:MAG: L-aspartate oxidase [Candidatus Thorarchaeota archaeon]|nr:L-aspartate oxidase [Candidatus Thorarchaeota archaeon]